MNKTEDMRDLMKLLEAAPEGRKTAVKLDETKSDFKFLKELNESSLDEGPINDLRAAMGRGLASLKGGGAGKKEYRQAQFQLAKGLAEYLGKLNLSPQKDGSWKSVIIDWLERTRPEMMKDERSVSKVRAMFANSEIFEKKDQNKLFLKSKKELFTVLHRIYSKYNDLHPEQNDDITTQPRNASNNNNRSQQGSGGVGNSLPSTQDNVLDPDKVVSFMQGLKDKDREAYIVELLKDPKIASAFFKIFGQTSGRAGSNS